MPVYEPGKVSALSRDELQKYPAEKIPYLIFNKSDFQASKFRKLPRIDNLPVLEYDDIDKEKEALFLKINDLHDRNKMHPFDQTVSEELEERKNEYYKKYKKDFSGVIADDNWFWQIRFDFSPPIVRDENKERAIWNRSIQPIVKLHNLQFQYKFFPKTIPESEIYSMLRETMVLCQVFPTEKYSDDFFYMVMENLGNGITELCFEIDDEQKKVDLKYMFCSFLSKLFKEERLPYFLELLDRECTSFPMITTKSGRKAGVAKMAPPKFSNYQQLNLTELKVMAEGWANKFPVIKDITLYHANIDGKYILDVRIDDIDKDEYKFFKRKWIRWID